MRYHSHFLACVVTLATLIHLSSWTALGLDDEVSKQSVRLDIGFMKHFAQVWPIAEVVLAQVKNMVSAIATATEDMIGQQSDTAAATEPANGS